MEAPANFIYKSQNVKCIVSGTYLRMRNERIVRLMCDFGQDKMRLFYHYCVVLFRNFNISPLFMDEPSLNARYPAFYAVCIDLQSPKNTVIFLCNKPKSPFIRRSVCQRVERNPLKHQWTVGGVSGVCLIRIRWKIMLIATIEQIS